MNEIKKEGEAVAKSEWILQPDGRLFEYIDGIYQGWVEPMGVQPTPKKPEGERRTSMSLDEFLDGFAKK